MTGQTRKPAPEHLRVRRCSISSTTIRPIREGALRERVDCSACGFEGKAFDIADAEELRRDHIRQQVSR